MVKANPEKPWKNLGPHPDPDRLLSIESGNIGSVEAAGPGVEYAFDADRALLDATAGSNDFAALVGELKGKDGDAAKKLFADYGVNLMKSVGQAGSEDKDRAWEMIETCARQTGLNFPHVLQLFAELFILCSRPVDKWAIVESHTTKMRIHQYSCSYLKAQQDAGLNTDGLPCRELCLSAFRAAANKHDVAANIELTKELPADQVCEFTSTPL
jgi:hypothetical protein